MNSTERANQEKHYILIAIAVVIMIVGVYLRFADFKSAEIAANIILIVGVLIGLKAVFDILE